MAAEQEALKGGSGGGGASASNNGGGSGRNRGGVQRVEGKLRASVEKGDYYEAHQMYRTLFFRYEAAALGPPSSLPRPAPFQTLPATRSPAGRTQARPPVASLAGPLVLSAARVLIGRKEGRGALPFA